MVSKETFNYLEKELQEAREAQDQEAIFELRGELALARQYERDE